MTTKTCRTRAVLFLSLLPSAALAQSVDKRGFYLDAGIGFGNARFGRVVDTAIESASKSDKKQTTLSLDFSAGIAVAQSLYLVGAISCFGDTKDEKDVDGKGAMYVIGPGIRYYPLSSKQHLQLGLDAGISKQGVKSSETNQYEFSDQTGAGVKLSVAYDIDWTLTGPTVLVGVEAFRASVAGEKSTGVTIFVKVALK